MVGGGLVEVGFELFLLGFQLDEAVQEVVQGFLVEADARRSHERVFGASRSPLNVPNMPAAVIVVVRLDILSAGVGWVKCMDKCGIFRYNIT